MNQDDIIRMANEAWGEPVGKPWAETTLIPLKRFAALIAATEREVCAKLLDQMAEKDKLSNYYKVAALRIRERGTSHD